MFNHYLTTALRHFRQHRLTTAINIVCLTGGLVCFLAVHWWITSSRSGDGYFPNADRIVVLTQASRSDSGFSLERPVTAWKALDYLRADFPEIDVIARATDGTESGEDTTPAVAGENEAFVHIRYADADFLRVFALPFLTGDAVNALRQPRSAVITKDTAAKLFGTAPALGKTILLRNSDTVTVTGVTDSVRSPSHMEPGSQFQFDMLVSMDVYTARAAVDERRAQALSVWGFTDVLTYAVLPADGSLTMDSFRKRLESFSQRHVPSGLGGVSFVFSARPINGIGLDVDLEMSGAQFSMSSLLYFLGSLVLFIGCINYANLATALASSRSKEVGMRRVVGASRSQVMTQHLVEAALQSTVALLLAAALLAVLLAVWQPAGIGYVAKVAFTSAPFWSVLLGLWLAVTLIAGALPAFVLSRIRPLVALRTSVGSIGGGSLPALLVGGQFVVAGFLLACIFIISAQSRALTESALSGMSDPVVVLRNNLRDAKVDFDTLRTELQRQSHIESVTGSVIAPWSTGMAQTSLSRTAETGASVVIAQRHGVNYGFFDTLGIRVLAGRAFSREHADDRNSVSTEARNAVVNVALMEQLGWLSPSEAVGNVVYFPGTSDRAALPVRIVGVVEPRTLVATGPGAALFLLDTRQALIPTIRISKTDIAAGLAEIDAVWKRLAPTMPMKRQFADEVWEGMYQYLRAITGTITVVAMLAVLNAVLGLAGMSLHVIGRRFREIGVRKTLGASVLRILTMLLRDSARPVVVGSLIAWPLTFVTMQLYLGLFPHRIAISVWPFLLSLAVTLGIACMAVMAQAVNAARMNPATVLRYE
jgi:putative ABC transport system permease protein